MSIDPDELEAFGRYDDAEEMRTNRERRLADINQLEREREAEYLRELRERRRKKSQQPKENKK